MLDFKEEVQFRQQWRWGCNEPRLKLWTWAEETLTWGWQDLGWDYLGWTASPSVPSSVKCVQWSAPTGLSGLWRGSNGSLSVETLWKPWSTWWRKTVHFFLLLAHKLHDSNGQDWLCQPLKNAPWSLPKSYIVNLHQLLSCVWLFVTPWIAAHQASLSITSPPSLLRLMSIKSVMPSNHLTLCYPLLPPSIFPSIRVFPNESVLFVRWAKCWSSSFSISPSNEYSGLISFRIDWSDLRAVQGTLRSLL